MRRRRSGIFFRVKQTRGIAVCPFCEGQELERPRGSAEIRVIGEARKYAAPELVYHYVVVHDYQPPTEFITAVLSSRFADFRDAKFDK